MLRRASSLRQERMSWRKAYAACVLQEWDAITKLQYGQTPLDMAPPSCYQKVTLAAEQLTPMRGMHSTQPPPINDNAPLSTSARKAVGILAGLAALALLVLIISVAHMRGMNFLRRRPVPAIPMPFQSKSYHRSSSKASLNGVSEGGDQGSCYLEVS